MKMKIAHAVALTAALLLELCAVGDMRLDICGAAEFDVMRPIAGVVVRARDYGVEPEKPDNTLALNALLDACRTNGPVHLVFDPGVYHFIGGDGVRLEGLQDFVFDGAGAEFVFLRERGVNFSIRGCKRLEMRDFSVDWDWDRDPLASLVEIAETADDHVDFRFVHYETFPRRDVRIAYASPWDAETCSVGVPRKGCGRGFDMTWSGGKRPDTPKKWIGGNRLRIGVRPGAEFGKGDFYRVQHYYYDLGGFRFDSCAEVYLEKVEIKSCPGFALHFNGGRGFHLRNVNVRPPAENEKRVISCTADHLHVRSSRGFFKLEGCDFSGGGDDCANFHDITAFALADEGGCSLLVRGGVSGFKVGDPVELRNVDYSETGFVSRIVETRRVSERRGYGEIVFAERLPKPKGEGFVAINRRHDTHNIILRDCFFHDNRARGVIVQCPDVTIERCRFRHNESEAMKITTGWTRNLWCEGVGVTNMVVRNCVFERTNAARGTRQAVFIGTYMEVPSYERLNMTDFPILRDILFEGNRFVDIPALDVLVGSSRNFIFDSNVCLLRDSSGVESKRPERIKYVMEKGARR